MTVTGGCWCPSTEHTEHCTAMPAGYSCEGEDACTDTIPPAEANGLGCDVISTDDVTSKTIGFSGWNSVSASILAFAGVTCWHCRAVFCVLCGGTPASTSHGH